MVPGRVLCQPTVQLVILSTLTVVFGCTAPTQPTPLPAPPLPMAEVSGNVRFNGEPVHSALIIMFTEDGRSADAKITDGAYTLADAPVGLAKVQIAGGSVPAISAEEFIRQKAEGAKRIKEAHEAIQAGKVPVKEPERRTDPKLVSAKYGDPKATPLTYEVKPGKQTHDFDLPPLPVEN